MTPFFRAAQLDAMVLDFDIQGYLRVENALTADQVRCLNQAVDRHIQDCPENWMSLSDAVCEAIVVLPHTAAFDEVIESPLMLEILHAILGEDLTFEEFAIMLRNPTGNLNEVKGWHREIFGASRLVHSPEIFRFVEPKVFHQAARAFGRDGVPLKILVVPALPQDATAREQ